MTTLIKLAVSACLLGEPVRYDGGQKRDEIIINTLGSLFTLIPFCPEVECGMTTPREPMRLEPGPDGTPRLVVISSGADMTEQMLAFCPVKLKKLEEMEPGGFIFKERSPSCALSTAPLYCNGSCQRCTAGLFANEVARHFPLMPMVEAEHLHTPSILDDFIERVRLYNSHGSTTLSKACIYDNNFNIPSFSVGASCSTDFQTSARSTPKY